MFLKWKNVKSDRKCLSLILHCLSTFYCNLWHFCEHRISLGIFSGLCKINFFPFFLSLEDFKTREFLGHLKVLEILSANPYFLTWDFQHLNGVSIILTFRARGVGSTHNRIAKARGDYLGAKSQN